jgi:hypothetical protein
MKQKIQKRPTSAAIPAPILPPKMVLSIVTVYRQRIRALTFQIFFLCFSDYFYEALPSLTFQGGGGGNCVFLGVRLLLRGTPQSRATGGHHPLCPGMLYVCIYITVCVCIYTTHNSICDVCVCVYITCNYMCVCALYMCICIGRGRQHAKIRVLRPRQRCLP